MNQKIIISPLNEIISSSEQNFLNDKCNLILNDGNPLLIDLNSSSFISSPHSKNSNIIHNSNFSFNEMNNQTIIKNLDLKFLICNVITEKFIKPEMLILYFKIGEKFILLNDCDIYSLNNPSYNLNINSNNTTGLNSEMRSTGLQKKKNQSHRSSIKNNDTKPKYLYYKICNYTQKVIIDIYQNKIEKIIINISISCSVYMLKYLIFQKLKLKNLDLIKNHNIYGVGFLDTENIQFINKAQTNKKFNDNDLIYDIMKYYMEPKNIKDKVLNLILIENTPEQCYIGLDFKFNIMRNFKKLQNYDNNAPSYRTVSDGLNLFIYCLNEKCSIFNNYFTINKGYGSFDIFSILNDIICPLCNFKSFSLRNLGLINSKWSYKGFLKGVKNSKINGEGITLDNGKLYFIKEIIFENQFSVLFIEVEYYQISIPTFTSGNNNNKNSFQSSIHNIESSFVQSSSDISESDLNSINFEQKYLKDGQLKTKPMFEIDVDKEFTFQKRESKKDTLENNYNNIKDNNNNDINIINKNNNRNNNKNDIINFFNNNNSKELNKIEEECEIKLESKKQECCLKCSEISSNSCYLC